MKTAEWRVNSHGTVGVVFVDELTHSIASQDRRFQFECDYNLSVVKYK
jgi:hypothetical protein